MRKYKNNPTIITISQIILIEHRMHPANEQLLTCKENRYIRCITYHESRSASSAAPGVREGYRMVFNGDNPYKKKMVAPVMLITAPITCWAVIFSLNIIAVGRIMNMGVNAISAEAIPVSVCCTA